MLSFNYVPNTPGELTEFQSLHPQQWKIFALRYNPEYTGGWGPGFDNDIQENQHFDSWHEFTHAWELDQYNYCVNFYFAIEGIKQLIGFDENSDPVYATQESAMLEVVFWFIQPRKGYNVTVTVKNIMQTDMPKILKFLRNAQQHNALLFDNLPGKRRSLRCKQVVNSDDACIAIGRMMF